MNDKALKELPATGFIRENQLVPHLIPVSPATLRRMVRAGEFPPPVRLSKRVTAWRVEEVRGWMNSRQAAAVQ